MNVRTKLKGLCLLRALITALEASFKERWNENKAAKNGTKKITY